MAEKKINVSRRWTLLIMMLGFYIIIYNHVTLEASADHECDWNTLCNVAMVYITFQPIHSHYCHCYLESFWSSVPGFLVPGSTV